MMFSEDGYFDHPVAWLGVAVDRDFMSVSQYAGKVKRTPGVPWKAKDGTYRVIVMADCGEGAFMDATEILKKYIDDEPWRKLK